MQDFTVREKIYKSKTCTLNLYNNLSIRSSRFLIKALNFQEDFSFYKLFLLLPPFLETL